MKLNLIVALTAVVALSVGCTSTETKVDGGDIHARTFSFVDNGSKPAPDYADNRQAVHTMIQDAITKNLASRGISRVPSGGEIIVGYLVIINAQGYTQRINDYYGYGNDAANLQKKAHKAYASSKNPNRFEAGTLVIDIIDSSNFKLLKRNYATRQILRDVPADAKATQIQEVVDEILKDLRVER